MLGIGIDTGGTCTDAVIYDLDTREILATGKTQTTKSNLEIGIGKVLEQLPDDLLHKAEAIALSTTLATNACVENKGSRAKLLLIGAAPEMIERLQKTLSGYGINDISQIVVLDAKPENLFSEPYDPDWDDLKKKAPELFKRYLPGDGYPEGLCQHTAECQTDPADRRIYGSRTSCHAETESGKHSVVYCPQ